MGRWYEMSEQNKPSEEQQALPPIKPGPKPKDKITPQDEIFRDEYLVDLNAYRAAKAAGYAESTSRISAFKWVKDPNAKPELYRQIKEALKERSIRTGITADKVLERWWQIATADPNELTQLRRVNCRHCHGIDHKFQWRDRDEYERALADAVEQQRKDEEAGEPTVELPDDEGGYGFIANKEPNEECPKCDGEGKADLYLGDTRNLSPHGQALFAGIKQTKEGVEIKMHDQLSALNQVARHLGMFNDKLTLKGDAENPLEVLLKSLPGATLRPVEDENK